MTESWSTINALIHVLNEEFVHGHKKARIIEAVAFEAATRAGYPLQTALTEYESDPWVAEGLRRARIRMDKETENAASAGVSQDRGAGGDKADAVPERVAVGGEARARAHRGRRTGARTGAGEP